ncbi:unnamed protein product [Lactuca saligna]|uniref:Uncharacterized protein n=1 Tax=Lactuca saligna TaxID=75948 RepID=A0AA35YD29_LACSI|nr:unnamed protein product [Lactuca saligna]
MTSDDTGGTGGTPTSPIRRMMSLEPTTTPILTLLISEASQKGSSTVTTAPTTKSHRSAVEGLTSSTVVTIQSALMQTPQLTVISNSTAPPTVENVSVTSTLSQPPPLYQMVGKQPMIFETPPLNQMVRNQTMAFQTPLLK